MNKITSREFGHTKDGKKVTIFSLCNPHGVTINILDYGATIQSIFVPNKDNELIDIVLGYDDITSYENGSCFFGAVVGRFANRIAYSRFLLDDKEYRLEKPVNELHHVHGVFPYRMFKAFIDNDTLVLKYLSPDGEEGFPGNLNLEVRYSLDEDNSLIIDYKATCDRPTVINLTNHTYFNLNGQDGSTIFEHKVKLNSGYFTEYDSSFAQTGNIISVDGTPLDFKDEHTVGERFYDDYYQLRLCDGYDHNMIINGKDNELKLMGTIYNPSTGIMVEAFTTEPAFQFYSGRYIQYDTGGLGKNRIKYPKYGGLCLEAQHYPDSPNHPNFPSTILRPEETYIQKTIYKFITEK